MALAFGKRVKLGSSESFNDSDDTRGDATLLPQAVLNHVANTNKL